MAITIEPITLQAKNLKRCLLRYRSSSTEIKFPISQADDRYIDSYSDHINTVWMLQRNNFVRKMK